jgi:hypothetical protein
MSNGIPSRRGRIGSSRRQRRASRRSRPALLRTLYQGLGAAAAFLQLGAGRHGLRPQAQTAAWMTDYPCTRMHGALFEAEYYAEPALGAASP